MQISDVIDNFSKTLYSLEIASGKKSDELHEALNNIESATHLLNNSNLKTYTESCVSQLKELNDRIKVMEGGELSLQEVSRSISKISRDIFPLLDKPSSTNQLDIASSLAKSVNRFDRGDHAALQAFANWISANEIPLADLNWSVEEILRIAPYLTTVNLTDLDVDAIKAQRVSMDDFLGAFQNAEKMVLVGNVLTEDFLKGVFRLKTLENLQMHRCRLEGNFPDFAELPKLSHLELQELEFKENLLDFSNCHSLKSLRLVALAEFKGVVLLPKSGALEELTLDYLPSFNSAFDFKSSPGLKSIHFNLLRSYNQITDIRNLEKLESLEIKFCDHWDKGILMPKRSNLKLIDFTDCRNLSLDLEPIKNYSSLETIDLTNCRSLVSPLDFSKLPRLRFVSLKNCFKYEGDIDLSQAKDLKRLDVSGGRKIGKIRQESHQKSLDK